jgi:hypothetical protein
MLPSLFMDEGTEKMTLSRDANEVQQQIQRIKVLANLIEQ